MSMPKRLTAATTHGTVESILLARASSNAAALCGLANMNEDAAGLRGLPGWRVEAASPAFLTSRREGER